MFIPANKLTTDHSIYEIQIEGEILTMETPARILNTWQHGPCTTVLTRRGYVEYPAHADVKVA